MGIDNKDELDDELVKSLERLVEEETSVAKAFVDNQKESSAENTAAKDSQDTDIEMGKTKVIPKVTTDMLTKSADDVQKTGVYNVDEVRDNIRNIPVKNSDSGVNLDVDLDVNSDVSSDIDSDKHADSDKHVAGGTASDDKKKKIVLVYEGKQEKEKIISLLNSLVPDYMIPGKILSINSMPLNANGKIDRKMIKEIIQGEISEKISG